MHSSDLFMLARAFAPHKRGINALGAWCNYQQSILLRKPVLRFHPPAVMIEPTNICNLKCPLCPSGNGTLRRAKGMMSLKEFTQITAQLKDKTGMLILWNQGEPFLNPQFYSMLEHASEKRFYTLTSTNASLPMDAERIVKSGLNRIIISMDGISKETYNSYRVNGDYELVLQNMQALVKARRTFKGRTLINWQFIVMRHNEHEIGEVKRLAKSLGVDSLEFKTAQIYEAEDISFLPKDTKHSRYKATEQGFALKTELLNRCRRLWTQPVINWDGELSICCYDKDLGYRVGNVHKEGFEALWLGERMNKMRALVLKDRAGYPICRNCGEGIVQHLKL